MKIQQETLLQDEVEIHTQTKVEKKKQFIGSAKLTPGHRIFEVNPKEKTIVEALFEREIHFNKPDRRKIIIKPNCYYVQALNKKNAIKRFNKDFLKLKKP